MMSCVQPGKLLHLPLTVTVTITGHDTTGGTIFRMDITSIRAYWLWIVIGGVGAIMFFAYPGGYTSTSHMLLHGLCAQTPSHTFVIDGKPLPFDARMTGIYGGFLITLVRIVVCGRLFRYGNPPLTIIATLVVFVLVMAIDGTNSLLTDLGLWHPYAPLNVLRVITGYLTGVALAIVLSWLLASSSWNLSWPDAGIGSVKALALPVAGIVPYVIAIHWAPDALHLPLSTALVLSAWLTVSMLMLVIVLMAFRIDEHVRSIRHLHVPVAVAALLGISVMGILAGARFWLEHAFGISNSMM